ncbi:MAG TPA: polyhydroxyalkanoate synthesis repressor PhaR [Allosphingosinicella sp.]|jgi:polyhydroxyalkanoate synthesis repressor PhaR
MASQPSDKVVVIKKYANRRLYDTESSAYITLERLAEMVRQKRDFKVVDAKSGEDITHNVLTQIIMDEEARGTNMLPVNFLRQLISMYGDSVQSMVPQYLEASLEALQRNQAQFRDAVSGALTVNPLAEMARRNMEMFSAAATGLKPAAGAKDEPASDRSELAELRAQLADMQKKLDKLGD